jgi:hypothetical protein
MTPKEQVAAAGWEIVGPFHKDAESYLSKDGTNPEAPEPGYGWPLGTECFYYVLRGHGLRLHATGSTIGKAERRAVQIATASDPAREGGAVR